MINKPLVHWAVGWQVTDTHGVTSRGLDNSLGLSWRNSSVDDLIGWAAYYEKKAQHTGFSSYFQISRTILYAALLKEDAINNGINLEDKLEP